MEKALNWTNFYKHPRFWRHFVPWIVVLSFLYISVFAIGQDGKGDFGEDFGILAFGFLELLVLIYASFFAYNTLYKKQNKKALFFLVTCSIIILVALLDHFFNIRIVQIGAVKGFWANLITFPVAILVAFGMKLSYHGTKQLFMIERLQAKQTESELKLLKSQVNPHFLFNTLNNIYSTNLTDSEKANEIILELSDLLRYQLESNKSTFSSLEKEIESLENYIHLEKIRVLDCEVNLDQNLEIKNAQIVPLLLIPFVENAFKYGTGIGPGKIDIDIKLNKKKEFYFNIRNKIVQKKGKVHSGGIGLENVKKRLDIMYPTKHQLEINNEGSHFNVILKIQL